MAKIDDGELVLEIEGATHEQLQLGLRAARDHFMFLGADVTAAFAARARVEAMPARDGVSDPLDGDLELDDDVDLDAMVGEAWLAAAGAAGYDPEVQQVRGGLRLIEREIDGAAVVRDLFESAS